MFLKIFFRNVSEFGCLFVLLVIFGIEKEVIIILGILSKIGFYIIRNRIYIYEKLCGILKEFFFVLNIVGWYSWDMIRLFINI